MLVGQQLGPFAIEKELGAGAMGAVYLGRYTKTGAKVAVKVMVPGVGTSDGAAARFEREAAILKQFNHPNIVRLYGIGKEGNTRYYAMEYIQGESLDKVMARRGRFSWEEVVTLGQQLCAALQHAHEQGIVHRDLKPSNLMILKDGTLKLTDFGIAKDMDLTGLTGTNCTVGTAAYMSPEQCRGQQNLTHKSDLYSLGVVFYELITGRKPFQAENAMDMFIQHVKGKFERPSRIVLDLPVWLDTLICQLLEKKPEQRPRDAAIVHAALGTVKEKVETLRSAGIDAVAAQLLGGDSTAPKLSAEDKETSRTLMTGKSKKKKKKGVPYYRQGWFVLLAIMALFLSMGGLIYFLNRPPSPDTLYAAAEKLMQSKSPADHDEARDGPLKVFRHHYAGRTDEQAKQMYAWADQVEIEQADRLLQNFLRKLRKRITIEAQSASEELGFKAARAEETGDLDGAAKVWQELREQAGRTPWGLLAGDRLKKIDEIVNHDQKGEEQMARLREVGDVKLDGPEREAFMAYRAEHFADVYEGTSDVPLALRRYDEMKEKYSDDLDQRFWFLLGAYKSRSLKGRVLPTKDPDADRKAIVRKALDAADAFRGRSRLLDARTVCLNVIALYEKEPPQKAQVEEARRILKELSAKLT